MYCRFCSIFAKRIASGECLFHFIIAATACWTNVFSILSAYGKIFRTENGMNKKFDKFNILLQFSSVGGNIFLFLPFFFRLFRSLSILRFFKMTQRYDEDGKHCCCATLSLKFNSEWEEGSLESCEQTQRLLFACHFHSAHSCQCWHKLPKNFRNVNTTTARVVIISRIISIWIQYQYVVSLIGLKSNVVHLTLWFVEYQ